MGLFNGFYFVGFLLLCVLCSYASSSPNSDADQFGSIGRSLLQISTDCPVDFQNQNYSIILTKCKGPKFPADICCNAFKEFACPFIDQIDDLTTNCANTMFSYITLYGKYPPGLFANECKEGKLGLDCLNVTSYKVTNSLKKNNAVARDTLALVFSCIVALLLFAMV